MAEFAYLLMDRLQAARFRTETANDEHKLEPREIFVGNHKGKFALPETVATAVGFEDRRDAFLMLGNPVVLNASVVFQDPDEEQSRAAAEE